MSMGQLVVVGVLWTHVCMPCRSMNTAQMMPHVEFECNCERDLNICSDFKLTSCWATPMFPPWPSATVQVRASDGPALSRAGGALTWRLSLVLILALLFYALREAAGQDLRLLTCIQSTGLDTLNVESMSTCCVQTFVHDCVARMNGTLCAQSQSRA